MNAHNLSPVIFFGRHFRLFEKNNQKKKNGVRKNWEFSPKSLRTSDTTTRTFTFLIDCQISYKICCFFSHLMKILQWHYSNTTTREGGDGKVTRFFFFFFQTYTLLINISRDEREKQWWRKRKHNSFFFCFLLRTKYLAVDLYTVHKLDTGIETGFCCPFFFFFSFSLSMFLRLDRGIKMHRKVESYI